MTDRPGRQRDQGFTLFELLLVMSIVAIMVSVVVLSLSPDNSHRELEREAKRLTEVLRQAADEAVFQDRELGLVLEETQYHFVSWDREKQRWLPLENDTVLRAYQLPESVRLHIIATDIPYSLLTPSENEVEAGMVSSSDSGALSAQADNADSSREDAQVWFLSSAEVTPFVIELSNKDEPLRRYTITASAMGDLVLDKPHAH